jgi:septal ring factor EnvC (AmiA/AmiB activator)
MASVRRINEAGGVEMKRIRLRACWPVTGDIQERLGASSSGCETMF